MMRIVLTALFPALLFLSCEQENVNGNVLVTVKENGSTVPYAKVYARYGALTDPRIPLTQYDLSRPADAAGKAYFDNLPPGDYYFVATGYDSQTNHVIRGNISVTIVSRHRMNEQDVIIAVH